MIIRKPGDPPDVWGRTNYPSLAVQTRHAVRWGRDATDPAVLPAVKVSPRVHRRIAVAEREILGRPSQMTRVMYTAPSSGVGEWPQWVKDVVAPIRTEAVRSVADLQSQLRNIEVALKISTAASVIAAVVVLLKVR